LATGLQVKKSTPGFTREAYLRFDLSSVNAINSAKLRLFGGFEAAPTSPVRIAVFGLDNPAWTETGITYANRPTGGTQLSIVTFTDGAQTTREWDLTAYLKAQKAAGHNIVTIALRALDGSTPAASFASDEAGVNKPQLVIS
jgi:endoglucanase